MGRPPKPEGERIRDLPPTVLRLPTELRDRLAREAAVNGVSLSGEIVRRLKASLPDAEGVEGQRPQFAEITPGQRSLLVHFSGMPPEKQLALLTLLKK